MDKSDNYAHFIEPIEGQMIGVIWRVLRDPDESDDALQIALAKIWSKRRAVFSHPNPKALILRICINSAYDKLRQRAKRQRDQQALREQARDRAGPSSDAAIQSAELRYEVMEQITRLPRRQAVAVVLRLVDEQPYAEIAQSLGCSESTARGHVAKGRMRLQDGLSHLKPMNAR